MPTPIEEFHGKLKDPYYGRPIVLRNNIPVGVLFYLMIEKTGEIVTFAKMNDDGWAVYGTDRKVQMLTTRRAENLVLDYVICAQRRKDFIHFVDSGNALIVREDEDISQYV